MKIHKEVRMINLTREQLISELNKAWDDGFDTSGEGYNGEYLPERVRSRLQIQRDTYVLKAFDTLNVSIAPEDY